MKKIFAVMGIMIITQEVFADGAAFTDLSFIRTLIGFAKYTLVSYAIIQLGCIIGKQIKKYLIKNNPNLKLTLIPSEAGKAKALQKKILRLNKSFKLGINELKNITDIAVKRTRELEILKKKLLKCIAFEVNEAIENRIDKIDDDIITIVEQLESLLTYVVDSIEGENKNITLLTRLINEIKRMNRDKGAAQKEVDQFLSE